MSPDEFIVIRHALPDLDPQVPPDQWHLGDAGRAAARRLATILPTRPYLVASEEPKAIETLDEAATDIAATTITEVFTEPDFGEVRRPHQWLEPDAHRHQVTAWLTGTPLPGWEPLTDVAMRFEEAVERHAEVADHQATLVVGTHGMAFSAWLSARVLIPDAATFHATLRYPDAYSINMLTSTVRHLTP